MAWSHLSSQTDTDTEGGGNGILLIAPTLMVDGALVVLGACGDTTAAIGFPTGFTAPAGGDITTSDGRCAVAYKVAATAESATYTISFGASFDFAGFCTVYSGVHATLPLQNISERTQSTAQMTADGVTASASDCLMLSVFGADHGGGGSPTWTSSHTERVDVGGAELTWAAIAMYEDIITGVGLTQDYTATCTSSIEQQGILMCFAPLANIYEPTEGVVTLAAEVPGINIDPVIDDVTPDTFSDTDTGVDIIGGNLGT